MKTLSIHIYLILILTCFSCSNDDDQELSNLNEMISFSINEQEGIIDGNLITFELDADINITDLTPVIIHNGVNVSPNDGEQQDFTNPVIYTVTAEDGSTQSFTVIINVDVLEEEDEPNDFNDIISFSINEQEGSVDANVISSEFDAGTNITCLLYTSPSPHDA